MKAASPLIAEPPTAHPEGPRRKLVSRLRLWRPATATQRHPQRPKKNFVAVLRQWHSRAGLIAFAFLIWLASTGILLTRSNELGLDVANVDWPWLTRMYGLSAEPPQSGFAAGGHWLAQTKNYTVLDGKALDRQIAAPLGMLSAGGEPLLFVASPESLVLLDASGKRVDEISAPILPIASLRRIGTLKNNPQIIAIQDLDAFQSSDEGNSWTPVSPTEVNWTLPQTLPEAERNKLGTYAKPRIVVEQLLIDLHSGRLFGPIGAWAITLIGFVALVLAISGIWMWWRLQQNRKRNMAR